jgi:hypothetical protein
MFFGIHLSAAIVKLCHYREIPRLSNHDDFTKKFGFNLQD